LVAETLSISRSSLYYRKRPHSSRADRTDDERIVAACGEKPAYGYRGVAWWLQRKQHMEVNAKRVLRVMQECAFWCGRDATASRAARTGAAWKRLNRTWSGSRT